MTFRTRAPIDPNQHKGLVVQNDNGLGGLLIPSGRSLANSIPIDVALVDSTGAQTTGIGSLTSAVNTGQQTTNTTAVQLSAVSTVPANGIIVAALSSNSSESIFIGGSGVTTANGMEIQTGASVSFTCNLNTLYIISTSSTTNKVCWNVV